MELDVNADVLNSASEEDRDKVLSLLSSINFISPDTKFVPVADAPGAVDIEGDNDYVIARPFNSPATLGGVAIESYNLHIGLGDLKGYACDIAAAGALALCVAQTSGVGLALCTAVVGSAKAACKKAVG